jgi:hypothetical protein
MILSDADVDRVARRIVELLDEREAMPRALVDVAAAASALSVSQKFVRKHAIELGGRQLVRGGPWRFDLAKALRAGPAPAAPPPLQPGPRIRRAGTSRLDTAPLLPVRGLP